MSTYTSEEFERMLAEINRLGVVNNVVTAALRIASNAMRPGVIEAALKAHTNHVELDWSGEAAAIRQALTGESA